MKYQTVYSSESEADSNNSDETPSVSYEILLGALNSRGGTGRLVWYEAALKLYFIKSNDSTLHGSNLTLSRPWMCLAILKARSLAAKEGGGER